MSTRHASTKLVWAVLMLFPIAATFAADKDAAKSEVKAAGIFVGKKNDAFIIKVDGADEPIKCIVDPSDKRLVESLKGIFDACRVQVSYKQDGDLLRLVSMKRQVTKPSGAVTGDVVKVYNDFWIELKPKTGLADAYAPGADNWNNKEFMEKLKGLQPGDSVTITYTTDFERHRIKTTRINPPSPSKSESSATKSPSK